VPDHLIRSSRSSARLARDFISFSPFDWRQRGHKGYTQNFIDVLRRQNLKPLEHVGGYFSQILFIVRRNDDGGDTAPERRQQLFLEAADRKHPSPQRHFARHRDIVAHCNSRQRRNHCRHHANPC
jgi:hypothetical protein